jgi:hypothetical protein
MEELKAMFRVCAHIKKDGVRCNSPAMKGMNFCYQHIGGNVRELTRARSIYNGPKLDFVYPGCRQAIQHNFFVIAQAMNDGKIDLQTANTYNRIYSACERNLRRFETLYQKDAEAEFAPLPEAPASETSPTDAIPLSADVIPLPPADVIPTENLGGPLKPGFGLSGEQTDSTPSPTDDVILSEVDADRRQRVEGSAVSQSNNDAGAPFKRSLSGEQEQPSPTNVTPTEPTPIFDIQTIDYKKYDPRFKELERLHSSDPDYIDHLRAAIRQIQEEEEQAWRAAGCPSLAPVP